MGLQWWPIKKHHQKRRLFSQATFGHTSYRKIPENYRNTGIPVKNTGTCEIHLLKKPILALIEKRIYREDNLEKPRGQWSSCEQRRLIRRLIWVFTGRTGLIVLKVFSKFSWSLFPQISFIPLFSAASDLGLHCLHRSVCVPIFRFFKSSICASFVCISDEKRLYKLCFFSPEAVSGHNFTRCYHYKHVVSSCGAREMLCCDCRIVRVFQ